mmetsp:Transcript_7336/g.19105  ORF Transcript_7336/g.19105 Transcript_7336/m.19105 type:complete len:384 (+) Transcript_7336:40-1191(+)
MIEISDNQRARCAEKVPEGVDDALASPLAREPADEPEPIAGLELSSPLASPLTSPLRARSQSLASSPRSLSPRSPLASPLRPRQLQELSGMRATEGGDDALANPLASPLASPLRSPLRPRQLLEPGSLFGKRVIEGGDDTQANPLASPLRFQSHSMASSQLQEPSSLSGKRATEGGDDTLASPVASPVASPLRSRSHSGGSQSMASSPLACRGQLHVVVGASGPEMVPQSRRKPIRPPQPASPGVRLLDVPADAGIDAGASSPLARRGPLRTVSCFLDGEPLDGEPLDAVHGGASAHFCGAVHVGLRTAARAARARQRVPPVRATRASPTRNGSGPVASRTALPGQEPAASSCREQSRRNVPHAARGAVRASRRAAFSVLPTA